MNQDNITDLKKFKVKRQLRKIMPLWCSNYYKITEDTIDKIADELIANQINHPTREILELDEKSKEKTKPTEN